MSVSSQRDGRVPALDGIRGVAIAMVLLWHGFFDALTNLPNHPMAARLIAVGRLSWSGVDLFFVLSGFLIGGILLDAAEGERYFFPFYMRRAHRILPLYAIVVAVTFLLPLLQWDMGAFSINQIPLGYYIGFLQNFWMAKNAAYGSAVLGVTWSLAVEEQFYLTLPLAIRYIPRARLWWLVAGMIAAPPLIRALLNSARPGGPFASYVLMPCRADALGFGLAAALIMRSPRLYGIIASQRKFVYAAMGTAFLALVALLCSDFKPGTDQIFGLEYSLLGFFYFLMLLGTLINSTLKRMFSIRVLRYLGTIAYGLYLLHYGCIFAVRFFAFRFHRNQSGWLTLWASLLGLMIATVMAALSWEYLEKPLIRRGHHYRYETEKPAAE